MSAHDRDLTRAAMRRVATETPEIGSVVKLPAGGTGSAVCAPLPGAVAEKAGDLPFEIRRQLIASCQMDGDPGAINAELSDPLFARYVRGRRP